jgi:hypothetical protein
MAARGKIPVPLSDLEEIKQELDVWSSALGLVIRRMKQKELDTVEAMNSTMAKPAIERLAALVKSCKSTLGMP